MPRDLDFEKELCAVAHALSLNMRQAIYEMYAFFRGAFGRDPVLAEAQLVVLIRGHLEPAGVAVIAPLLALGALRNDAGRYEGAADAFSTAARWAPADPRGWAGYATALFGLCRYRESAQAWETCLSRIEQTGEQAHHRFVQEVRHNAARAFLEAGDARGAWTRLAPAMLPGADQKTEDLILAGKILLSLHDRRGGALLRAAAERLCAGETVESGLMIDLLEALRLLQASSLLGRVLRRAAESYPLDVGITRQCAVHAAACGDPEAALSHYRKALRLAPENLRCLVELAMLDRATGGSQWRELVQFCSASRASDACDDYFVGLAHFLEDREETEQYYYSRAGRSSICRSWPFYRQLVSTAAVRSSPERA